MAEHKFKVGQIVRAKKCSAENTGQGAYEVRHLLPPIIEGKPLYRIRHKMKGTDHVVGQAEIKKA